MMTKEKLLAMGFTEEQCKNILALHKETLDGQYVAKARLDETAEELKNVKAASADKDKQIKELGAFKGTADELTAKVAELEKANKQQETGHKAALAKVRKENAIKQVLLTDAQDPDMVLGLLDVDKIEVGDDGKIKSGFKEQFDNVKKEKPFLFKEVKPQTKQQFTPQGKKPAEGDPNPAEGDKDASVELAKKLATGGAGNADATQKASAHYFGTAK